MTHARNLVKGAILAGGAASRFGGRPKGLEVVGGERVVDRLAGVMREALGKPPVLIANDPGAVRWDTGLRIETDVLPGYGALGGIHAAVARAPAPVVAVAWDMPFVNVTLVRLLADALVSGTDAVLPASEGRRGVEPLCAAYGPACEPAIRRALERGDRRAIAFHDAIVVAVLPLAVVERAGAPELLFFNINTAEDLAQAERQWQRVSSAS
ncbi:MAG TPA: molybdenum cofactor guanylyltransferase [Gemmatimonadales bacterium]|jgi:molybdopterin-guanine dinucleotide biosynthesis protein A|nr:molybdenum cofactor guanylyltransferase [Gemmatimonadales bacterium]